MPVTLDPTFNTANITLSNGNLTLTNRVASAWYPSRATAFFSSGKLYFEVTCNANSSTGSQVGVINQSAVTNNYIGYDAYGWGYQASGSIDYTNANQGNIGSWTTGDTLSVAFDIGNALVWFRKNGGNWDNNPAHNPATAAGGYSMTSLLAGARVIYPAVCCFAASDQLTANFGATAFAQAVPAGFLSVSSAGTAAQARVMVLA